MMTIGERGESGGKLRLVVVASMGSPAETQIRTCSWQARLFRFTNAQMTLHGKDLQLRSTDGAIFGVGHRKARSRTTV